MKGQSHLILSAEPLNWSLRPPEMSGLCGAIVKDARPGDSWSITDDQHLPSFNSLRQCGKCIALVPITPVYESDEWGNLTPAKRKYVYELMAGEQYAGEVITEIEKAVDKVQR